MCGGGDSTQTTRNELPAYEQDARQFLLNAAKDQFLNFTPQYFPGSTVADPSANTQAGVDQLAGFGQSPFNQQLLHQANANMNNLNAMGQNPLLQFGMGNMEAAQQGIQQAGQGLNSNQIIDRGQSLMGGIPTAASPIPKGSGGGWFMPPMSTGAVNPTNPNVGGGMPPMMNDVINPTNYNMVPPGTGGIKPSKPFTSPSGMVSAGPSLPYNPSAPPPSAGGASMMPGPSMPPFQIQGAPVTPTAGQGSNPLNPYDQGQSIANQFAQSVSDPTTAALVSNLGITPGQNPLVDEVIKQTLAANTKNFKEDVLPGIRNTSIGNNAFGGTRSQLAEGKAVSDLNAINAKTAADIALGGYNTDSSNRLQAAQIGSGAIGTGGAQGLQNQQLNQQFGLTNAGQAIDRFTAGQNASNTAEQTAQGGNAQGLDIAQLVAQSLGQGGQLATNAAGMGLQYAPSVQNMNQTGIRNLLQAGGINDQWNQQFLNDQVQNWNFQQGIPQQQLDSLIAAFSGIPSNAYTQTAPGPSSGGIVSGIGGASSGLALGSALGGDTAGIIGAILGGLGGYFG